MSEAIVAPRTTTPATGTTNHVQNLLTHIKSTSDSIDKGDILGSAMGVTNVALDVIGIAGDPLGAISSAGVGWVLNAVKFLREPFDILMGNPSAITNSAQSWMSAANNLSSTAQQYRQSAVSQTCNWTGNAGNGYRTASTNQANGLESLARASQAVSSAMTKAGQAVAKGRQVVMDLISQAVQQIIQICIEALAASWLSFGASIAKGIAQSVQKAVTTAQKTMKKVKEVVDTLQQIIKTVQQIMQLVQQVKQLMQQIGGKATGGSQPVQPQGQAVGYAPDSSGYYNTGAAGYSGTTQPTSTGGPGLGAAPGTPQVSSSGADRAPVSTGGPGIGAAPGTPQVSPSGAGRTPVSTGGPGVGPAPGTPQVQPAVESTVIRITPNAGGGVTIEVLRQVMPNLGATQAAQYLPMVNAAMTEAGINTPPRQAAFLAQLSHESGQLRYMEEIASGRRYEGRRDLGNTQPGDGERFKGRGPIQLTGRANYEAAGRALGLDLVNNPQQVARPEVGFRTAAWYWQTRGLNELADQGNFREITHRINGGYNGQADRVRYHEAAQRALGIN